MKMNLMMKMKMDEPLSIRLLTHNIRYATNSPFKGEEKWDIRKPRLINELSFNTACCAESFICLQEVLHQQLVDILSGLNSKKKAWDFVGVGRDDGVEAGEYSPICTYFPSPSILFRTKPGVLRLVVYWEFLLSEYVSTLDIPPQICNTDNETVIQCTDRKFGYVHIQRKLSPSRKIFWIAKYVRKQAPL